MAISTIGTNSLASGAVTNASIAAAAGISTSKLGTGAVLQVVSATTTSGFTSSGTQVTVLEASITPASASNKVLIMYASGYSDNKSGGNDGLVKILRGGSAGTLLQLVTAGGGATQYFYSGSQIQFPTSMQIVDSPATTSSTTYGVYIKNSTGTCGMSGCSLVLLEIAG